MEQEKKKVVCGGRGGGVGGRGQIYLPFPTIHPPTMYLTN